MVGRRGPELGRELRPTRRCQLIGMESRHEPVTCRGLEDAACLVFLENEIAGFAEKHAGYSEEKYVEILRKTWRKMSPAAQEAARALALPPAVAALLQRALASG